MNTKLYRKIKNTLLCLSAVAVTVFSSGCYLLPDEEEVLEPPTVKASSVSYSTVTAKRKNLEKKIVTTGTVTAQNQYGCCYEKQSGTIAEFMVRAGDKVKEGDVICKLDTYELDYQIEVMELNVKKSKLNVDIIYESGGTQAQIDSAYVDYQLMEKELDKLKAQKEAASLKSPIDGVVSSISDVRVGDYVNAGQTVATVIDTSALYIAVQPSDMTKFEMGTQLQIRINEDYYDGEVFMTPKELIDYQEEQSASHEAVDTTGIDYQADTIYVKFVNDAPTETVGQLADTILMLDSVENAIVISNNLIKTVDGEKVVYVLKNGEKTAVNVEIGLSTGSQTEIVSGISEGDELILR